MFKVPRHAHWVLRGHRCVLTDSSGFSSSEHDSHVRPALLTFLPHLLATVKDVRYRLGKGHVEDSSKIFLLTVHVNCNLKRMRKPR